MSQFQMPYPQTVRGRRRAAPALPWMRSPGLIGALIVLMVVGLVGVLAWHPWTAGEQTGLERQGLQEGPTVGIPDPQGPQQIPAQATRWDDPATWGGQVPLAGQDVTIPAGRDVVVIASPAPIGVLTINGSLTFGDADLTLQARAIMVHGALQVGSQQQPFTKRARIVLTGKKSNEDLMEMGTKVIGVMGGRLDLHGRTLPTWTKLGATLKAGSRSLTLAKPMPWAVGDRIAVASTDFNPTFSEVFTITSVQGSTIGLNSPTEFAHWGRVQTVAGQSVDQRAEVALLSHNVTVEGEQATSSGGFGGQIMVMAGSQARIAGVELTRMGQKSALRRYPIHFHLVGDGSQMYVKNSSIHHTFNRCITIHGIQNLTVSGNTCYDHIGHGIFFEDGSETGVRLSDNLSFRTRKPPAGQGILLSDEQSPASFWITNPNNAITGNVAAGSDGMGFWLAPPKHVTGLSAKLSSYTSLRPATTALGTFRNNTAHSNDRDGVNVNPAPEQERDGVEANFSPRKTPTSEKSAPVVAVFEGITAYKNRDHGVWLRGSHQQVHAAVLADNAIGATFANDHTSLRESLVVGETANTGTAQGWEKRGAAGRALPRPWQPEFPIRGFEFYDGDVGTIATTFAQFTPNAVRQASGLGLKLDNGYPTSADNFATSARFVDALPFYAAPASPTDDEGKPTLYDSQRSALFHDTDGSVTGSAGSVVMARDGFNAGSRCTVRPEWNAAICPAASYIGLSVEVPNEQAALRPLTISREGASITLDGPEPDSTTAYTTAVSGQRYTVAFATAAPPAQSAYVMRAPTGGWVEVEVPMPTKPQVSLYGCDIAAKDQWCYGGAVSSTAELARSGKSCAWWDSSAGLLYLRLVAPKDGEYVQLQVRR